MRDIAIKLQGMLAARGFTCKAGDELMVIDGECYGVFTKTGAVETVTNKPEAVIASKPVVKRKYTRTAVKTEQNLIMVSKIIEAVCASPTPLTLMGIRDLMRSADISPYGYEWLSRIIQTAVEQKKLSLVSPYRGRVPATYWKPESSAPLSTKQVEPPTEPTTAAKERTLTTPTTTVIVASKRVLTLGELPTHLKKVLPRVLAQGPKTRKEVCKALKVYSQKRIWMVGEALRSLVHSGVLVASKEEEGMEWVYSLPKAPSDNDDSRTGLVL